MKNRKNKLTNFLKIGVLFFGISLLLWNCEKNEIIEELNLQDSELKTVSIESSKSFFKTINNNTLSKKAAKGNNDINLEIDIESVQQIELTNTSAKLNMANAKTKFENVETQILQIEIDGELQTVLFHQVPENNTAERTTSNRSSSSYFSGSVYTTNLSGMVLSGFKINNGNVLGSFNFFTGSYGTNPTDPICYTCGIQQLDEVIIHAPKRYSPYQAGQYNPYQGVYQWNRSINNYSTMGIAYANYYRQKAIEEYYEKINNELTGKDKCIYNKLEKSNLFKATIKKFENSSDYELTIDYGNCNNTNTACTDGSKIDEGKIKITIEQTSGGLPLEFAAIMLHEGIHAEIFKYVDEYKKGIDPNNRENLLYHYFQQKQIQKPSLVNSVAQHQHMADKFVKPIAQAIRALDNNKYPLDYYMGFGWDGLRQYGYDGYFDNGKWVNLSKDQSTDYYKKQKIVNDNTKLKDNECKE